MHWLRFQPRPVNRIDSVPGLPWPRHSSGKVIARAVLVFLFLSRPALCRKRAATIMALEIWLTRTLREGKVVYYKVEHLSYFVKGLFP